MSEIQVHPFYRIWFTWVDPIVLAATFIGIFIDPNLFMINFVPASISRADPNHAFLFHHIAVFYGFIGLMVGVLQRVSSDIRVWKIIQGSVLYVDIALIWVVYAGLKQQGRLHPDLMRAEDWAGLLFTAWVAVIRIFFVAGVGVREVRGAKKRQ
ncbi:hypothetical protein F5X68DRAFT_210391 [Plectosphaerella plurivora]|uniref:DUF7704 domain-containing protein n=1 Tax=Plectosphaerella plurivora TaxID=936078 RepID=A0A9P8V8R4_9PEZI|nr:hypothetical protein F5X68DRAFT_210391 [Plectosphaerella plurivora]